ncbi:MAG TPA: HAMP domain-containing sensor histidine kinase [Solirubrobacteraceae bacterium]|nr:HAMP domain-containing sensor histidine kinase [Solirubrobacteraceae bacterium]
MGLRWRLALTTTLVVAGVVVVAALACYLVMRDELRGQVDDQLRAQTGLIDRARPGLGMRRRDGPGGPLGDVPAPPARAGGPAPYTQLLEASGQVQAMLGQGTLPVTDADRAIAVGTAGSRLSDRRTDRASDAGGGSDHVRVLTAPIVGGGAVMLGRSLAGVDRVLARLRLVLALLCLVGIGFAALLGRRAADRFVAVLDRLEGSQAAQRQLVADASHELRTPVTALRTNAELLLEQEDLAPAQRRMLLADVVDQTEELTALVADLIELARGDQPAAEVHDVRLDALVAEAVERARRHAPHIRFSTDLEPVAVDAVGDRLGRAVNNLLDNAAKYSPDGGDVDVTLRGGALTVRDYGPGVPADELPHIFDRFFRATNARAQTGSGLGLAIVKQVAERHGGSVAAVLAPGGGLAVTFTLPGARAVARAPEPAGR